MRMEQRQRTHSTGSGPSSPTNPYPAPPANTHSSPLATPTHTPPNASPQTGSTRRRPRRPAPIAPGRAPQTSHTHQNFPYQYSPDAGFGSTFQTTSSPFGTMEPGHTQSPFGTMESGHAQSPFGTMEPGHAQSPFGTMEPGQHPVLDLDIAQLEETQREDLEGGEGDEGEERYFHEAQRDVQQSGELWPAPVHQRSVSDTSVLLCRTNSSSLPELTDHTSSASPEPVADTVEEAKQQIAQESPTKRFRTKHTRHLSLLNRRDGKQKKRRSQYRCRSPPNYPPPPPPTNEDSDNDDTTHNDALGFSKVMETISSIDQELQEMGGLAGADTTPNISPPMRFRGIDPPSQPSPDEPRPLSTESEGELRVGGLRVEGDINTLTENHRYCIHSTLTSGTFKSCPLVDMV